MIVNNLYVSIGGSATLTSTRVVKSNNKKGVKRWPHTIKSRETSNIHLIAQVPSVPVPISALGIGRALSVSLYYKYDE